MVNAVTGGVGQVVGTAVGQVRTLRAQASEQPSAPVGRDSVDLGAADDRPVVGLCIGPVASKAANYAEALEASGLRVKILDYKKWVVGSLFPSPVMAATAALRHLAGVVITGGGDIDPQFLGIDTPHPTISGVEPFRDVFERAVAQVAYNKNLPMLGICRGMQVINWTLGGTLYQDIDTEVAPVQTEKGHRQIDRGVPKSEIGHDIDIEPGSHLEWMFGTTRVGVNSDHHQAVKDVAPGFHVTARGTDGVVEAIESHERPFVVGVQFHPELMWRTNLLYLRPFLALAAQVRENEAALA